MDGRKSLLVISNDSDLLAWFEEFPRNHHDVRVSVCRDEQDVEAMIARTKPQAVLVHVTPSSAPDVKAFERIKRIDPLLPVITVTEEGTASIGFNH